MGQAPSPAPGASSGTAGGQEVPLEDPTLTATIKVDGKEVPCRPGEVIIQATDRAGIYVPRFCYHPRMKPVGMCRMCLVEVSGPRGMSLQPACFMPVADGMEVLTSSPKAAKAQEGVLEFLLLNHPLDCPVCDKGGECPLQDQTLSHGPGETRFVEEKRHWAKPIALSDLVLLDRERCIQCARCTRFAEEVAGEPMIDFLSRGDEIEVAIFPEERFTSRFSGNTVQICPVGALTSTPYRFAARPWDLEQVESTCTSCAMGCRVVVQSSADRVIRYLGVDSDPLNRSWLCDKGRYDYESLEGPGRVTAPMLRRSHLEGSLLKDGSAGSAQSAARKSPDASRNGPDELVEVSWLEAIEASARAIRLALDSGGPSSVAVLGGARLANEDAYAWAKLCKSVIGTDSVDADLGDGLPVATVLGLPKATVDWVCGADVVVTLGADVHEDAPVLYLRLKEAIDKGSTRLIELSALPTALSRYASISLRHRPGEIASLAAALVAAEPPRPPVAGAAPPPVAGVAAAEIEDARALLAGGGRVAVVIGRPSLAESAEIVAAAAASMARGLPEARFLPVFRRANLHGALDAGLSPGMAPGRTRLEDAPPELREKWGGLPTQRGMSAAEIVRSAASGRLKVLVLLGADPVADMVGEDARRALESSTFVIALTAHMTASARLADVVLPVATYAERGGTTTNFEGRVLSLGRKVTPPGQAWEDWVIAAELAVALGRDLGFESLEDIVAERAGLVPLFRGLTDHLWASPASADGFVLPLEGDPVRLSNVHPVDRVATPGIGSLTRQHVRAPGVPTAGSHDGEPSALPTAGSHDGEPSALPTAGSNLAAAPSSDPPKVEVPPLDAYSLRLVAPHRLFDLGTHLVESPHLAELAQVGTLHVNHYDLDRLGAASGDRLRAVGPTGTHDVVVEVDDAVPRGVALMGFNLAPAPGTSTVARDLVDAASPVTDIRLEAL
jgi:NADH-quinone oxidoreductase subunit G